MIKVYLGLGGNVGKVKHNLKKVIKEFTKHKNIYNVESSPFYETSPYGNIEQKNFINCVVTFETKLSLEELFDYTKDLEQKIGRKKREVWGPREIDIDILLFGDEIVKNKKVTIPHKDLLNRDFVLVPLLELDEDLTHPATGEKLKKYLPKLEEKYILGKVKEKESYHK